jgi:dienelactone hydrolase
LFLLILIISCLPTLTYAQSNLNLKGSIWNVPDIYKTPEYKIISHGSAIGLVYKGLSYRGHKQNVFAYYASPATLNKNKDNLNKNKDSNEKFPAVVLVHGGGGRAYKSWAIKWAKKGYAAIAMDLFGNGPNEEHIKYGFIEKEYRQVPYLPYFKITSKLNNQWMYQAVADVILAHNLILSFPEVDSSNTALTGISWGGVIAYIVAALDHRFKVVVPVYGCGYLWESGRMKKQLNQLSAEDREIWLKQYDPSNYMMDVMVPILFLNDAQDPYFVLKSYMKTYHKVKSKHKSLCIKIHLKHSNHAGWSSREIYYFINHYINGTPGLPIIDNPVKLADKITAKIHSPVKIEKAFLHYTSDTSPEGNRKWTTVEVSLKNKEIISPLLPQSTTIWYLSLIDNRGLKTSSKVQFIYY